MSMQKPWLSKYRSSEWFIVLTVAVAAFTELFLGEVIVPVMPYALKDRLNIPANHVQDWISIMLAVYGAALLIGSPIFGWFADRTTSRRQPYLAGLLALLLSTMLLCFGTNVYLLVLGRALQGLSAAAVWTVGLAMLVDTVGQSRMGQTMGYVSVATVTGLLGAPVLGGVLYDRGGYYCVFGVSFGVITIDILLRALVIERDSVTPWHDQVAQVNYGTIETSCPAYTEEPAPTEDLYPVVTACRASLKQPSIVTVIAVNDESPLIAPKEHDSNSSNLVNRLPPIIILLTSPRLLAALWGIFAQTALMGSFEGVLPLFVQETFGWNSAQAGLIFIFLFGPTVLAPFIGGLSDKLGARYIATSGFLVATLPLTLLLLVRPSLPHAETLLCSLIFLTGLCLAFVTPPMSAEVSGTVKAMAIAQPAVFGPSGAYAQAYALYNMSYAGAMIVGPIWAGFIKESQGWGTMCWSLGILSAVSAVPTVLFTGGFILEKKPRTSQEDA